MAGVSLIVLVIETLEHKPHQQRGIDYVFWSEVCFFGLVLPVIGGVILKLLARIRSEKGSITRYLELKKDLSRKLSEARDWDELTSILIQFPRLIVPFVGTTLMVYDHSTGRYELVSKWSQEGRPLPKPNPSPAAEYCALCMAAQWDSDGILVPCCCLDEQVSQEWKNSFCLPLLHQKMPVAMLHLYFTSNVWLSEEQISFLTDVAPEMALAVERARLQQSFSKQTAVTEAEMHNIARDLHDTLGHNLAYLRLKLDQITDGNSMKEVVAIRHELERMRDIANEAYEQMRGTLTRLMPETSPHLSEALLSHARKVAARANLQIELHSEGQPRFVPSHLRRQILYIFREAIANVEKHANATRVDIYIAWPRHGLSIRIRDDGHGFEPKSINSNGHLGLTIMKERAEEIDGNIEFISSLGSGTEISLWFPLGQGQ